MVGGIIYLIPDRDWDLERKIEIEKYLLNEVMNSNIDETKVAEAIQEIEEKQAEDNTVRSTVNSMHDTEDPSNDGSNTEASF